MTDLNIDIRFILFSSFYIFALAEILSGLGLTFSSGADSARLCAGRG